MTDKTGYAEIGTLQTWSEQLADILEKLEEIEYEAESEGWLGVAHKILESRGPLSVAIQAAHQYETGVLEPR